MIADPPRRGGVKSRIEVESRRCGGMLVMDREGMEPYPGEPLKGLSLKERIKQDECFGI